MTTIAQFGGKEQSKQAFTEFYGRNLRMAELLKYIVTVQPAPFVKPHCVLIVADATVLLIDGRSAHTDVRSQKHASMFCASRTLYG